VHVRAVHPDRGDAAVAEDFQGFVHVFDREESGVRKAGFRVRCDRSAQAKTRPSSSYSSPPLTFGTGRTWSAGSAR
jgi:hypothetical protein